MQQQVFNLQIDSTKDKLNYAIHGTAYIAMVGVTFDYAGSPAIIATSFVASCILAYALPKKASQWMLEAFPQTEASATPKEAVGLSQKVRELSSSLQVLPVPTFHVMKSNAREKLPTEKPELSSPNLTKLRNVILKTFGKQNPNIIMLEALFDAFRIYLGQRLKNAARKNEDGDEPIKERPAQILGKVIKNLTGKYANAAAFGVYNSGIFVTSPLVRKLQSLRLKTAVIAHEMGHIAAQHMAGGAAFGFFASLGIITMAFNYGSLLLSSLSGLSVLGAGMVASALTRKGLKKLEIGSDDRADKEASRKLTRITGTTASLGVALVTGQSEVLTAWAAMALVMTAVRVVKASHSRCNEFQADRIAADVTGDPMALVESLRIINEHNIAVNPEFAKRDYKQGPLPLRAYNRAKAIFWTHPHVDRRCQRLEVMARRQASLG